MVKYWYRMYTSGNLRREIGLAFLTNVSNDPLMEFVLPIPPTLDCQSRISGSQEDCCLLRRHGNVPTKLLTPHT